MGGVQAAGLLKKCNCDVVIHINAEIDETVPAYGRIRGFLDICREYELPYEMMLGSIGNSFEENQEKLLQIVDTLEEKYPQRKKGIFISNDTHANILLNILVRRYGKLPETYKTLCSLAKAPVI